MDRHFRGDAETTRGAQDLRDVRLVSVTLDPGIRYAGRSADHAARLKADPNVWTFLTGTPADVSAFASSSASSPNAISELAPTSLTTCDCRRWCRRPSGDRPFG
jgi:hypothetical protein